MSGAVMPNLQAFDADRLQTRAASDRHYNPSLHLNNLAFYHPYLENRDQLRHRSMYYCLRHRILATKARCSALPDDGHDPTAYIIGQLDRAQVFLLTYSLIIPRIPSCYRIV